ncbi:TNF receptor-associated factor 3-like [Diadema antillarum]|uniref:TNF receptor-associated factor 3-like n=1 Tax=Diadema antillarum TaxID=105358 RepID=UPI003A868750
MQLNDGLNYYDITADVQTKRILQLFVLFSVALQCVYLGFLYFFVRQKVVDYIPEQQLDRLPYCVQCSEGRDDFISQTTATRKLKTRSRAMAEKGSENVLAPSIRSLQSDSGMESEGQPGSVGTSPPLSYRELEGYPPEIFKAPPNDHYLCGICGLITRWPVQTDCGCGLFCHGCLHRHIRSNHQPDSLPCPRCEEMIPTRDIQLDKIAHRRLQKLEITCPFGCGAEMLLKDLDKHEEDCEFVFIDCVNKSQGCMESVRRNELAEHLGSRCDYRIVVCDHCNMQLVANKLQDHQKTCAFTESISKLMAKSGSGNQEPEVRPAASQDLVKSVATNLEAKIAELRRMVTEIDNEVKTFKTLSADIQGMTSENKQSITDVERAIKSLQKMVLSKLSKLPTIEKKVEASLTRDEFDEYRNTDIQDMKDELEVHKEHISLLQDQANTGSASGSDGLSNRAKEQLSETANKVRLAEDQLSMHSMRLAEHELRFQFQETASYDGTLIWKIKEFTRRKRDADNGKTLSLYSQPFYTSRFGYKMCARIYLNGDGIGKGTHVSLFFVVMRGDYDALLNWPFSQKVTLMLLDQETGRRHLSDSFRPDPTSTSFQRPSTNMNIASGCPLFVSQSVLKDNAYVKEDTIFIKVVVETTDLYGP